jgi:hypothetical protein
MKSIFFTILLFVTTLVLSQNNINSDAAYNFKIGNILGDSGTFYNIPKDIVGNIYVFEDWNNKSILSIGDKVYRLTNINLNMKTDMFEAKVGKDSMFAFNTSNIDYIIIKNRKFKSFYVSKNEKNRNFELIYDGDKIKLLKGYEVGIKYNDPDPLMVKKNVDNYFTTKTYYIKTGDRIEQIKLKKKDILNIFGSKANVVGKFVKDNKLSYKKEKDLNKIFIYHGSL